MTTLTPFARQPAFWRTLRSAVLVGVLAAGVVVGTMRLRWGDLAAPDPNVVDCWPHWGGCCP